MASLFSLSLTNILQPVHRRRGAPTALRSVQRNVSTAPATPSAFVPHASLDTEGLNVKKVQRAITLIKRQ